MQFIFDRIFTLILILIRTLTLILTFDRTQGRWFTTFVQPTQFILQVLNAISYLTRPIIPSQEKTLVFSPPKPQGYSRFFFRLQNSEMNRFPLPVRECGSSPRSGFTRGPSTSTRNGMFKPLPLGPLACRWPSRNHVRPRG